MFHRIGWVGRLAMLVASSIVASGLVAFALVRWLGPSPLTGVVAALVALAICSVAAALAGRWAVRPLRAEVEARTREALAIELGDVQRQRTPPPEPAPVEAARATRAEPSLELAALYEAGLRSCLRQAALAMEKAAEPGTDPCGVRLLLTIGHSASVRGQDLLTRLERRSDASGVEPDAGEPRREPVPLREDLASAARGLGFELGRQVAIRYSMNFPAQALAERALFRLALTTIFQAAAQRADERAELLIEASHEELPAARVGVRIAVSASGAATIGELPAFDPRGAHATPALQAVARLLERESGRLDAHAAGTQLAFTLPVVRYKRVTGTTLYGMGALAERTALVIDPRPIGGVTICEQLAAWRLSPTGAASVDEGLVLATRARQRGERFECVVVSGFGEEHRDRLREVAANLAVFQYPKVVSLEEVESVAVGLPSDLVQVPGLALRRLARPPTPTELLELLTSLLVPVPASVPTMERRGSGLSLLLAEDNNVNQALMVKLLERRGHSVLVAGNGADLVDRLWEAPEAYDAVLMDIQMPVMDGYEATAVIRLREAQSQRPRIPIIAVTAHAMGGERERCMEAGMDGYLPKPITERELAAVLDGLMLRRRETQAPPPARVRSDVFDRQHVLEVAAGDMAFLRGLVDLFGDSAPKLVAQIASHLEARDADGVYRTAHQLKGSIGNFGADRARLAAAAVEEAGKRGDLPAAASLLPSVGAEVDELIRHLRDLVVETASR